MLDTPGGCLCSLWMFSRCSLSMSEEMEQVGYMDLREAKVMKGV